MIPIISGPPTGNRMTVLQVSFNAVSLTAGTPLAMYIQPSSTGNVQVGYFIAHVPITLNALTGYAFLSTGSTTGTVQFALQTVAMSSIASGTGVTAAGSFANISGVTTGSLTPSTTGAGATPYIAPLINPPSYNAGQIFQIVATASGSSITNFCASATLRVTTQA